MRIDNDDYWSGFVLGSILGILAGIGIALTLLV
jgi:hypothetical protein